MNIIAEGYIFMKRRPGYKTVIHSGLKGQVKITRKKLRNPGKEFKLALQAAIFTTPHTQGVALGWYKLALQAGIALPLSTKSLFGITAER